MKDSHRLKVRGMKKIFHTNGNNKKVEVAIVISGTIDLKKVHNERQRRALYNEKGINTRSG